MKGFVLLLACGCFLTPTLCSKSVFAQSFTSDEEFLRADFETQGASQEDYHFLADPTPPPGFGPDYTITKSGNGTVSISVSNTEDFVACFIMRDGEVVGVGARARKSTGTTVASLEKNGSAYNVGKGPSQTTDTIDCS